MISIKPLFSFKNNEWFELCIEVSEENLPGMFLHVFRKGKKRTFYASYSSDSGGYVFDLSSFDTGVYNYYTELEGSEHTLVGTFYVK